VIRTVGAGDTQGRKNQGFGHTALAADMNEASAIQVAGPTSREGLNKFRHPRGF
jgi:hypothetical protein